METGTPYSGIHHTAFGTGDIRSTVHFWRDLLGLRLSLVTGKEGDRQYFFSLGSGGVVSFFEWPETTPIKRKTHGKPVKGPFAFDHLSIGVVSKYELIRIQLLLEKNEFPVSDVIDHGFIHSIYTFDPNGIPLEFTWELPDREIEDESFEVGDVTNSPEYVLKEKMVEGSNFQSPTKSEIEEALNDSILIPGSGSDNR